MDGFMDGLFAKLLATIFTVITNEELVTKASIHDNE
jgi:hypothetical protein